MTVSNTDSLVSFGKPYFPVVTVPQKKVGSWIRFFVNSTTRNFCQVILWHVVKEAFLCKLSAYVSMEST